MNPSSHRHSRIRIAFPKLLLAALALLFAPGAVALAEPAAVEAEFDGDGLAALRVAAYGGGSILVDGDVKLARVQFASAHRNKNEQDHQRQYKLPKEDDPYAGEYRTFRDGSTEVTERSFDRETRTLTQRFAWGTITATYAVEGNQLDITLRVDNRSDQSIEHLALRPVLSIQLPGEVKAARGHHNIGAPTVIPIEHGKGMVALANEGVTRPLVLKPDAKRGTVAVVLKSSHPSGGREVFDGQWVSRPIAPGGSDRYKISLRFGTGDADRVSLGRDVYLGYREAYPRTLRWRDRRPIGTLFLTGGQNITEHNPLGYSFGKDAGDLSTEQGMKAFRANMRQFTDRVIQQMHAKGLQGVIVWDLEAAVHKTNHYLGSPRFMPVIDPAMNKVADEMFARLNEAGLRTGITLRPLLLWPVDADGKRVDRWNDENAAAPRHRLRHRNFIKFSEADHPQLVKLGVTVEEAQSPFDRLNNKIAHAKKRWGCTLFYIDTVYFWRPRNRSQDNDGWKSLQLPAAVFRKLNEVHPDVLIIPEQQNPRFWAYTAPYHELGYSPWKTRDWIRAIWPESFVVQQIANRTKIVRDNREAFADIVKAGDSVFVHGWWGGQTDEVCEVYGRSVEDIALTVRIDADGAIALNGEAVKDADALTERIDEAVEGKPFVDQRVFVTYKEQAPAKTRKAVYAAIETADGIIAWSQPIE